MRKNVNSKLMEILTDQLAVDKDSVMLESNLVEDLGMDSLDGIELTLAIEEEFEIAIDDDEADSWKTVEDIQNYLDDNDMINYIPTEKGEA